MKCFFGKKKKRKNVKIKNILNFNLLFKVFQTSEGKININNKLK